MVAMVMTMVAMVMVVAMMVVVTMVVVVLNNGDGSGDTDNYSNGY